MTSSDVEALYIHFSPGTVISAERLASAVLLEFEPRAESGDPRAVWLDDACGQVPVERLAALFNRTQLVENTYSVHASRISPEDVPPLEAAGVNRLCLRTHEISRNGLERLVRAARTSGIAAVALDLHRATQIDWAVQLQVDHVSTYGDAAGTDPEPLHEAGYRRYEQWSYARKKHACRYTLTCWNGGNYLGLGPGAASHVDGRRWANTEDVRAYVEALEAGVPPPREYDPFTPERVAADRILCGLHLAQGVDLSNVWKAVEKCFPTVGKESADFSNHWKNILSIFQSLKDDGRVENTGTHWRLTHLGWDHADEVASRFV